MKRLSFLKLWEEEELIQTAEPVECYLKLRLRLIDILGTEKTLNLFGYQLRAIRQ